MRSTIRKQIEDKGQGWVNDGSYVLNMDNQWKKKIASATDSRPGEGKFRFRYVTLRLHKVYQAEVLKMQLETELVFGRSHD